MAKSSDRIVYRDEKGIWVNKPVVSGSGVSSLHTTQEDAEDVARKMVKQEGGGELITKGLDGKIRSKDTIAPGNDPNPPKDKEH